MGVKRTRAFTPTDGFVGRMCSARTSLAAITHPIAELSGGFLEARCGVVPRPSPEPDSSAMGAQKVRGLARQTHPAYVGTLTSREAPGTAQGGVVGLGQEHVMGGGLGIQPADEFF